MSDFKSKVPFPVAPANLPTYDGGHPGKSAVRSELARLGGQEGIRSSEWADADGMTYRLDTRNGFPEIVATAARKKKANTGDTFMAERGFIAHVPGEPGAARFSPYSLAVQDPNYLLFGNVYTVLPIKSTYNVPTGDTTDWLDIISFYKGKILVNGLEMKDLQITSPPIEALPWLIPHSGPGLSQYGDKVQNLTEKRVFAIYREKVHSWQGGVAGVTATLNNPSARPYKALMCGSHIEPVAHKAWLSQFAFTGESWDSLNGGWAFTAAQVSMMLTTPYLEQLNYGVSSEQSLCIPTSDGTTAGTEETALTLPPCQIGLRGTGWAYGANFPNAGSNLDFVRFPYLAAWIETPEGFEFSNYSRSNYSDTRSSSADLGQYVAAVTASNTYYNGSQSSYKGIHQQGGPLPQPWWGTGGATVLDEYNTPAAPSGIWAAYGMWIEEDHFNSVLYGPSHNNAGWYSHKTTGDFKVEMAGHILVGGTFSRYVIPPGGNETHLEANDWASAYFNGFQDLVWHGPEFTVSPYVRPENVVAIQAKVAAAAAAWIGAPSVTQGDANEFGGPGYPKYITSYAGRAPVDDQRLNWTTKDFILFDALNGCYISIDSVFAGTQSYSTIGTAQLVVNLNIQTPMGNVTQTIFTAPLTYSDMLPEHELEYGFPYVPSPQQRVIFTPKYQEQGDFKGAAYTTAAELANGATAAYLFNFVLKLDTYAAVGQDQSAYQTVNFIPCNLIEMLYAYVYSSKYGVDEDERYPVDNQVRFKSFQTSLFSGQWRVNYRNGALVDWLDTLGAPYIADTMTELYRA